MMEFPLVEECIYPLSTREVYRAGHDYGQQREKHPFLVEAVDIALIQEYIQVYIKSPEGEGKSSATRNRHNTVQ